MVELYSNPDSVVSSPFVVVNTTLPAVDPAVAAGRFVNCEPSPIYVPKDAVDVALEDMFVDAVTGPNISIESSVHLHHYLHLV